MKLIFFNPHQVRLTANCPLDNPILRALAEEKTRYYFKVISWSDETGSDARRWVDRQPDQTDPARPNEPAFIPSDVRRVWFHLIGKEP